MTKETKNQRRERIAVSVLAGLLASDAQYETVAQAVDVAVAFADAMIRKIDRGTVEL